MFENYTYDSIRSDALAQFPDGIDTRKGSIAYDAISGICIQIAKLYFDLDLVFTLTQVDSATGDYLDLKASEYGLTRQAATCAQYYVTFEGTTPDIGERFYTDGLYFVLCEDDDGVLYLKAETAGTGGNNVYSGTAAVPCNNIEGLTAATFGEIYSYGTDDETDDSLRSRMQEKITGPAQNGNKAHYNKAHYKTWCESVTGVGTAIIYPLWNGPNTVKAVLITALGLPCSDSVVEAVQEYVDPATQGYTATVNGREFVVGDGVGEGAANLGAHFTASAPEEMEISIAFSAEIASGYDEDDVAEEAETAIAEYLAELALATSNESETTVRVAAIGSVLSGLDSLLDYSDLTLNGETSNITVAADYLAVCGEVSVSAV